MVTATFWGNSLRAGIMVGSEKGSKPLREIPLDSSAALVAVGLMVADGPGEQCNLRCPVAQHLLRVLRPLAVMTTLCIGEGMAHD